MHSPGSGPVTGPVEAQTRLPFVLMRGGTSKAVFVRGEALPTNRTLRDASILSMFGSPDPRQIDGLGGADILTSKLAISHTSGVMPVRARVSREGDAWRVDEAVYFRTARRLAEGTAFIQPVPRGTAG